MEEERTRLIHDKASQGQTSSADGQASDLLSRSTIKCKRYGYDDENNICEALILKALLHVQYYS